MSPIVDLDLVYIISHLGSSVATSLAFGESLPKHCVLLKIKEDKYQMKFVLLKTVRPLVFDSQSFTRDTVEINTQNVVVKEVRKVLDGMLEKAKKLLHDGEGK